MRKHCFLNIFIFLQFFCSAQKDTLRKRGVEPGTISINAGLGYSKIDWSTVVGGNPYPSGTGVQIMWIGPAFNASADYSITRISSLGIGITYQCLAYYPGDQDVTVKSDTCVSSRLNIALRYLVHLSKRRRNDFYMGCRSGLSIWTNQQTWAFIPSSEVCFSFQFLCGYHVYVSNHLALQFEAGIGTPYLLQGGLAYRVFSPKQK